MKPMVSCLCCTHGRFTVLREALACFLMQDHGYRELIILNNHPVPVYLPGGKNSFCREEPDGEIMEIYIVNEAYDFKTLGEIRQRCLDAASQHTDYIRPWDDDDLNMPWALSDAVAAIGDAPAFKPKRSWTSYADERYELNENNFEASYLFDAQLVRDNGYDTSRHSGEQFKLVDAVNRRGGARIVDLGIETPLVARWENGLHHVSGGGSGDGKDEERRQLWVERNQDTGEGEYLTPLDPRPRWEALLQDTLVRFGSLAMTTDGKSEWDALKTRFEEYKYGDPKRAFRGLTDV